jgi:hypothetical protein
MKGAGVVAGRNRWPGLVHRLYRGIWPASPQCTASLADTGALGEEGQRRCVRREHVTGLHELTDGTTWV